MKKVTYLGCRFYFDVNDGINTDPYIVSFFKQGGKKRSHNDQQYVYDISRSGKMFRRALYSGFANVSNSLNLLNQFLKDNN